MTKSIFRSRTTKFLSVFLLGIAVGGYLFIGSQARSFPDQKMCVYSCYGSSELAGLIGSVGMRVMPGVMPKKIAETERCIAMEDPSPDAPVDIVVIPKKDILDIADVASEDAPYVLDCIGMIRSIVHERHLSAYKVMTNGQGLQKVRYLHFHILAS
jgi:histidine triad (HIT) family protein